MNEAPDDESKNSIKDGVKDWRREDVIEKEGRTRDFGNDLDDGKSTRLWSGEEDDHKEEPEEADGEPDKRPGH